MPKNKMSDLRNHLFETLEGLRDEENPMDIKRALAVSRVAQTIIDSAKAEIQFMEATGEQVDTDFFGELPAGRPRLMSGGR
jgi:hypothetical protein